ncbi:MAG: winged helix-turn-helix domain-containing protein [Nanobdellota archaeon]
MELDSFLASPRWEILKIISEKPSSPIEIAEKTKTTVSFVSQQLKLLEAAQIVSKEKTGAFEKGKPRNLFSISKDILYSVFLTNGFSEKKSLDLEDYQKSIFKVWLLENKHLQYFLEDFIYKIKDHFQNIGAIFVDTKKLNPSLIIFLEDKKTQQIIETLSKKYEDKIKTDFYSFNEINKLPLSSLFSIYQNPAFPKKNIEMKGGKKNEETI